MSNSVAVTNAITTSSGIRPADSFSGSRNRTRRSTRSAVSDSAVVEAQELADDQHCPICLNAIDIYAVGECGHSICYVCSTRLRALANNKECPICRLLLPMVSFSNISTWDGVSPVSGRLYNAEYAIRFADAQIKSKFAALLVHGCSRCHSSESGAKVFPSFATLEHHVRQAHKLSYCNICAKNLFLFPHERKLYTQAQLSTHMVSGDVDDTSQRGHPMCQFCRIRFLDADTLFAHSRKEHFSCHFCDADGKNLHFPNYDVLKKHFKSDHFLCDDEACKNDQFTHAFRTALDLRVHQLRQHMSRTEAKVGRNISIIIDSERRLRSDRQEFRSETVDRERTFDDARTQNQHPTASLSYDEAFPSIYGPVVSTNVAATQSVEATDLPDRIQQFGTLSLEEVEQENREEMERQKAARRTADVEAPVSVINPISHTRTMSGSGGRSDAAARVAFSVGNNVSNWSCRSRGQSAAERLDAEFPVLPGTSNDAMRVESKSKPPSAPNVLAAVVVQNGSAVRQAGVGKAGPSVFSDAFPALPSCSDSRSASVKSQRTASTAPTHGQASLLPPMPPPPPARGGTSLSDFPTLPLPSSKTAMDKPAFRSTIIPTSTTQQTCRSKRDKNVATDKRSISSAPDKSSGRSQSRAAFAYDEPVDCRERGRKLITTIRTMLAERENDKSAEAASLFAEFRTASQKLRHSGMEAGGDMSMGEYYALCLRIADHSPKRLIRFFGELLVLLPDILLQNALARVHETEWEKEAASSAAAGSRNRNPLPNIVRCTTCGQYLHNKDFLIHFAKH